MRLWRWITLGFMGINLLLLLQLFGREHGVLKYRELIARRVQMQTEIQVAEAENQRLSQEIRHLKADRETMEKVIRSEMHYNREGEVMYLFPGE